MGGVLHFNFLPCIWQVRTLLPAVPINPSKRLLTLGNALSVGAQCYSKMLYLQVFPTQHMVGGVVCGNYAVHSASSAYSCGWVRGGFAIRRTLRRGRLCWATGTRRELNLSPNLPRLRWNCLGGGGGEGSPLLSSPHPLPALHPWLPGRSSPRTRPHPDVSSSLWEHLRIPQTQRCSQRLGSSAAGETKKLQLAQLFKRSCNMLLLWVIAGFFYTDITIIILSSRKN